MKKIFISYSHESDVHKKWVHKLANELEQYNEIHVVFDQYDLSVMHDKNKYMENAIYDTEIILVIATETYTEKANSRLGGVGIETSLATVRHWEESEKTNKSSIVVIKRDESDKTIPNYLKTKIYIDFSDDNKFSESLSELIDIINKRFNAKRPKKTKSIADNNKVKSFNRAEDILKINYKKRKNIITLDEGTDYSSGNKIKYEFWEVSSPKKHYFLFLYSNIIIKDTVNEFIRELSIKNIKINEITILKDNIGDVDYIKNIFQGHNISIDVLKYGDFVWEFCIDDTVKNHEYLYTANLFVDQELILINEQGEGESFGEAALNLIGELRKDQHQPASIIIAPGGMGKTTLCHNIINRLSSDEDSMLILISSEMIRQTHIGEIISNSNIESIYDLYEVFLKIDLSNSRGFSSLDKNTFELGVLCGKIVVIVDGLDEFVSTFQDKFNLEKFIDSVVKLNDQLGKSKVLLTSRENIINSKTVSKNDMLEYHLIGFDEEKSLKYLDRRFSKYNNKELYVKKAQGYILEIINSDSENRVIPFFVDLISSLIEEHNNSIDSFSFDISLEGKDYESNSDLLDSLVYSVLRREKARQRISNSTYDVISILEELSAENGESFSITKLEDKTDLYFDDMDHELAKKISRNPLLVNDNNIIKFKYDILSSYFLTLYLIDCINSTCLDSLFLQCVSKYSYGVERVFKEVVKYFKENDDDLGNKLQKIITVIVEKYKDKNTDRRNKRIISKSISFILHLHYQVSGVSMTKTELMDSIHKLYGSTDKSTIKGLCIYGEYPILDFSNLKIWKSLFVSYNRFPYSEFKNCRFYDCRFDKISSNGASKSFSAKMFDRCNLGALEDTITYINNKGALSREAAELELKKFLSSFFNSGKFKDNKKTYIKFSNKLDSLQLVNFDNLIKDNIIEVVRRKSHEIYYGVTKDYRKSVYDFIVHNRPDPKIKDILYNQCSIQKKELEYS